MDAFCSTVLHSCWKVLLGMGDKESPCSYNSNSALNSVAHLVEHQHCPVNQKVADSIPVQSTYLHCRLGLGQGAYERQLIYVSLPP